MTSIFLVSIQVGQPESRSDASGDWTSAVLKRSVNGPVRVASCGLEGDHQADIQHHGGPEKAILAYASEHYSSWSEELGIDIPAGGLGDNLTLRGLDEHTACIGDRYRIGSVTFEVSQPRQPCWKPGRLWGLPELIRRVVATDRCGWYLRVVEEGHLTAGDNLEIVGRPHPDWSIVRANRVMFGRLQGDSLREEARRLVELPELSSSWRIELTDKYLHREDERPVTATDG